MPDISLLFDLPLQSAERTPDAVALTFGPQHQPYADLQRAIAGFAAGLLSLGIARGGRVGI